MSITKPMMVATGVLLVVAIGVTSFAVQKGGADDRTGNSTGSPIITQVESKTASPAKTADLVAPPTSSAAAQAGQKSRGKNLYPIRFFSSSPPAEQKIRAEFDKQIEQLDFEQNSLQDLVEFLEDIHQIEIEIETHAFEDIGISVDDVEVTARLSGISLRSALNIILGPNELTTVVEDEVLKITTVEAAKSKLVTRVYLLGTFYDESGKIHQIPMTTTAEEFATLIPSILASRCQWDATGGNGTINAVGKNKLVITQIQAAHEMVADLLEQLRKAETAAGASGRSIGDLK